MSLTSFAAWRVQRAIGCLANQCHRNFIRESLTVNISRAWIARFILPDLHASPDWNQVTPGLSRTWFLAGPYGTEPKIVPLPY